MTCLSITRLLADWEEGDIRVLGCIVPPLYEDLRRAAAGCLRQEWRGRTMGATALVHEAYVALRRARPVRCASREHFVAVVKRLMRQILVQYARRRSALKRGGAGNPVTLDEGMTITDPTRGMDLEDALERLRRRDPRRHLVIEMHYRGGYSVAEIAEALAVSGRSIERDLQAGRSWLEHELAA